MTWSTKMRWSFFMVARSTVSLSSFESLTRNGRARATKSVRAEAANRNMAGPRRTLPVGEAAMSSFSAASAATMRCTVERARSTRWAIWPRLKPAGCSSSARRIVAARAMTWTWLLSSRLSSGASPAIRGPFCLCTPVSWKGSLCGRPSLPAGSPIDTLQPEYGTENNGGEQPRSSMVKKIALEEHFLCPGFEDYWKLTVGDVDPAIYGQLVARLSDFGDLRLAAMDRAGIARSVLSLAGPGVQAEPDAKTACRKAREANDFLARQ